MKTLLALALSPLLGTQVFAKGTELDRFHSFCKQTLVARAFDRKTVRGLIASLPQGKFPLRRMDSGLTGTDRIDNYDAIEIRKIRCGPLRLAQCLDLTFYAGARIGRRDVFSARDRRVAAIVESDFVALARVGEGAIVFKTFGIAFMVDAHGNRTVVLVDAYTAPVLANLGNPTFTDHAVFSMADEPTPAAVEVPQLVHSPM